MDNCLHELDEEGLKVLDSILQALKSSIVICTIQSKEHPMQFDQKFIHEHGQLKPIEEPMIQHEMNHDNL